MVETESGKSNATQRAQRHCFDASWYRNGGSSHSHTSAQYSVGNDNWCMRMGTLPDTGRTHSA